MKFLTIGTIKPEHVHEALARFAKNDPPPKSIDVKALLMEADGHRFFVYHDTDSTDAMAEMSGRYDDICTFETFPVRTGEEVAASLKP